MRTTAREITRHALNRLHLDGVLTRQRKRRGQDVGHLELEDRAAVFSYIYERGVWLNGRAEGARSGIGSEVSATEEIRQGLTRVIAELEIHSLLDVGCGDFTWMQHVDLGDVDYLGVDVVPSVIAHNQQVHGGPRHRFATLDAVNAVDGQLPKADAVLCREVLIHLSFSDARRLLQNVQHSGAKYLIATHDTETMFNADIKTGDYRLLNLEKRPFSLPSPIRWIPDTAFLGARGVGVWRLPFQATTSSRRPS
jgi:2-polyprenyl-3-methyl-5-hydroxy-6-metoxy-1,4-benzoquinol methylase